MLHASPQAGLALGLLTPAAAIGGAGYTGYQLAKQWGFGPVGRTVAALGAAGTATVCPAALFVTAGLTAPAKSGDKAGMTTTPTPFEATGRIENVAEAAAGLTATGVYSIFRQFAQGGLENFFPRLKTAPLELRSDQDGRNDGVKLPDGVGRAAAVGWGLYSGMRGLSSIAN
jgi:hypothetical protein